MMGPIAFGAGKAGLEQGSVGCDLRQGPTHSVPQFPRLDGGNRVLASQAVCRAPACCPMAVSLSAAQAAWSLVPRPDVSCGETKKGSRGSGEAGGRQCAHAPTEVQPEAQGCAPSTRGQQGATATHVQPWEAPGAWRLAPLACPICTWGPLNSLLCNGASSCAGGRFLEQRQEGSQEGPGRPFPDHPHHQAAKECVAAGAVNEARVGHVTGVRRACWRDWYLRGTRHA